MNRALLSSKNNNWCTPKKFFDELDSEFHFVLDVAANEKSAKCKDFFTPEQDGLLQSWKRSDGAVFCNPPYGREIGKWVKKKLGRKSVEQYDNSSSDSGENRHQIFPRLHLETCGNTIYSRSFEIYQRIRAEFRSGAISVNAGYLQQVS